MEVQQKIFGVLETYKTIWDFVGIISDIIQKRSDVIFSTSDMVFAVLSAIDFQTLAKPLKCHFKEMF